MTKNAVGRITLLGLSKPQPTDNLPSSHSDLKKKPSRDATASISHQLAPYASFSALIPRVKHRRWQFAAILGQLLRGEGRADGNACLGKRCWKQSHGRIEDLGGGGGNGSALP